MTAAHIDFSEQKKFHEELRHLRRVRALSDGERVLFARSLDHDSGRKVAGARAVSALARLVYALGEEGIRFQTQAGSETSRQAP
jgi:hypothetical protein